MAGREDVFQDAMNEGHSAAWNQEWDKAAVAYQRALEEFPARPKALNSLGLALFQLKQYDDSLKAYRRVAELSPNDPIPLGRIAQLCEYLGDIGSAVEASLRAADLYMAQQDADRAVENWVRVIRLDPENITAHSNLALIHERLGHKQQAVTEYLAVASLIQRTGGHDKTAQLVERALVLMPESREARQASALLKSGQLLPKPTRLKESTEPLQVAQAQPPRAAIEVDQSGPDPIAETRQRAMARLADFLLDYSGKSENEGESRGLRAIVRGTGQFSLQQAEQTKVVKHLSQAIEAQMNGQDEQAAEELEHALEAGFNHPSLYFDLGLLRSKGDRLESALRHLRYAVKHQDYALGARLLMAQILHVMGRFSKATMEYLEALKLADATVVPAEYSDEIRQAYEPLIESLTSQADQEELSGLCESIGNLLMRPNWREHLRKVREQLPQTQQDETPMPVVEVLTRVRSSQALEAMSRLHQLARAGKLRLAMEEAFYALNYAPTYLPLHTLIGDLLVQEERTEEAIAKFTVVARTYDTYGEAALATKLLKRIIQLSPMDMEARAHLIDQLVARGHVDEAINEYVELAGMYYRLAELDVARKTYITALNLTQQAKADRTWNVHILQRIADIDMQRLDWRQALPVLEQIRVLDPDDEEARRQLIDLHLRLDQQSQAMYELGDYLSFLEENSRSEEALAFLENLVKDHGSRIDLRRALAEQYRKTSQLDQAIEQLNLVVESLLQLGDRQGAVETVNLILSMNPTNRGAYQKLLTQIQASG